jgi:hypothetical protein
LTLISKKAKEVSWEKKNVKLDMITKRTSGSSNFKTDINKYLIGCVIKRYFKIILIASTPK